MKTINKSTPYMQLPETQAIRIITNLSENLKENISYSTDSALHSLQQYIQFVAKEDLPLTPENQKPESRCPVQRAKKFLSNIMWWDTTTQAALCPFVPGMNKKNLHYALLYNQAKPDFDDFYKTCFQELATVHKHNKNKLATLYGIFSNPDLDTQEFSDALQMYCMKRKSEVVTSWHMAWAMLSRHRPGWAERIFNKETFSTKANNFKTEWFSYIAFRDLHFDDFGSMRTPENMQAFMPHFPGVTHQIKYIPQFIQFLEDKIKQDKEDIQLIEKMDPASIIIHYYEHHLMHYDSQEIIQFKDLLEQDISQGKKELEKIIKYTQKKYELYIGELKRLEQEALTAESHLHPYL
jgi:hypothetical protein